MVFCNEIFAGPKARKAETIHYTLSSDEFIMKANPILFHHLRLVRNPPLLRLDLEHAMSMQTLHTLAANIR